MGLLLVWHLHTEFDYPVIVGGIIIRNGGWIGMALGILALWMMGLCCVFLPKMLRKSILTGGAIVALTQLFPLLHVMCGIYVISGWVKTTGLKVDPPDSLIDVSSFGITVLVGQIMIAASTGTVFLITLIHRKLKYL